MNLNEKIDLLLKRQEQQDKALANMASFLMKMNQFTNGFQKAGMISLLQAVNHDAYEGNKEKLENEYYKSLNQADTAHEHLQELYKAIRKNLEADRFNTYKFKVTVKHEQAPSI